MSLPPWLRTLRTHLGELAARSLRVRLLAWMALVLFVVVAGFATILYYESRRARFGEIDAQLTTAVTALDASLRLFPRYELTGEMPPPPRFGPGGPGGPGGRPGGGRGGPDGRPGGPDGPRPFLFEGERGFGGPPGDRPMPFNNHERLMNELVLPASVSAGEGNAYFAIWRGDGALIKSQYLPAERPRPSVATYRLIPRNEGSNREVAVAGPHDTVILVGRSVERVSRELTVLRWQLIVTGAVVMAIGLIGGWLVSRRILKPVETMTAMATRISAENLSERIDETKIEIELEGLARALNGTFERLEAAFERQARFTADASHELRTPLAVIRSQAELALLRNRSPEEYRTALESCLSSAIRMTDLVERLLSLARADAGWPGLTREPVEFDSIVADVLKQLAPQADAKDLSVKVHSKPSRLTGDATLLTQLVTNLITNAVRYNRPGGKVRVTVMPGEGGISFIVADTGFGISETDRERLFERFYRVDKARSRAAGGTGLGLSICRAIVDAHGGWIDVKSVEGKGSEFRVWFPTDYLPKRQPVLPPTAFESIPA
jgi:two-component system OmpR family sensor kinase